MNCVYAAAPGPRLRDRLGAVGLLLLLAGCGGEEEGDTARSHQQASVLVATLNPMSATPARTASVASPSVSVLGVDADALPVLGVDQRVFVLRGDRLERRRLFAGPGDPVLLGSVRALRPRPQSGAWVATDVGLFRVDVQYVLPVAPVGRVVDLAETDSGPLAGLWFATPSALFLNLSTELARFQVPELLGPHTRLAVDPSGQRALTIAGPEALILEPDGVDLAVTSVDPSLGTPRDAAATASALWLATDAGLFALQTNEPAWVRVDSPSGPLDVVELDADASEAYARTEDGRIYALSLGNGTVSGTTLTPATAGRVGPITADGRGGFWVARTGRIEGYRLGAAPRFERDIRPFVETHCIACHGAGGADYRVYDNFAPRAEAALARLRTGDMPRCENDSRCPPERQLAPADYEILGQWIEEGLLQ